MKPLLAVETERNFLLSVSDNVISSKKHVFGLPVPATELLKTLEFPKQ